MISLMYVYLSHKLSSGPMPLQMSSAKKKKKKNEMLHYFMVCSSEIMTLLKIHFKLLHCVSE